jgi:cytochrome P450
MQAAADAFLAELSPGMIDVEPLASKLAADVIFRTLFSVPIEDKTASKVFDSFRTYQRQQPVANLAAMVPALRWLPFWQKRRVKRSALEIRRLITHLTHMRQEQIAAGRAPQNLATRLSLSEMVDQVMILFLAGHETSAAALNWALYLLERYPQYQDQVAQEAAHLTGLEGFAAMRNLPFTRDVFRETLRLYPPVPMMVREVKQTGEVFWGRRVPKNSLIIISPWYVQRHNRIWERPDDFDPMRWQEMPIADCQRQAFLPFSSGPRICPGAGFAIIEGPYLLARIVQNYRLSYRDLPVPQPLAHLTLRARSGIYLRFDPR